MKTGTKQQDGWAGLCTIAGDCFFARSGGVPNETERNGER